MMNFVGLPSLFTSCLGVIAVYFIHSLQFITLCAFGHLYGELYSHRRQVEREICKVATCYTVFKCQLFSRCKLLVSYYIGAAGLHCLGFYLCQDAFLFIKLSLSVCSFNMVYYGTDAKRYFSQTVSNMSQNKLCFASICYQKHYTSYPFMKISY